MALKIFPKLYAATRPQGKDQVDLGFVTPYEDNAAFRKRQETVDRWSSWHKNGPNPRAKILDNSPLSDFKITDDVKRVYWGGGNVVWRVEDPRGFELEISSANLMALLKTTSFDKGVINGTCVWARDGATNVLLHTDSEPFKESLKNYATANEKTATGIIPGTRVTTRTGDSLIYLGRHLVTYVETRYQPSNRHERESERHLWYRRLEVVVETPAVFPSVELTRRHLIQPALFDLLYDPETKHIIAYSKVKLVSMGALEFSAAKVEAALKSKITWAASGTYSRHGETIVTSKKLKLVMRPASETDISPLLYKGVEQYYRHPTALHQNDNFPLFVIEHEDHLLNLSRPCVTDRYGYKKVGGTLLLPLDMGAEEIVEYHADLSQAVKGGSGGPSLYLPPFTSVEQRDAWIKQQQKHGRISLITYGDAE